MGNDVRRRVVITGMGAVSPLGNTVESSWQAAIEGRSGIGPITRFDSERFETKIAGEVRDFNADGTILYVVDRDSGRVRQIDAGTP